MSRYKNYRVTITMDGQEHRLMVEAQHDEEASDLAMSFVGPGGRHKIKVEEVKDLDEVDLGSMDKSAPEPEVPMTISAALKLGEFVCVRSKRHAVWQSGRHVLILSITPSDHRTRKNELAMIKRTLREMGRLG